MTSYFAATVRFLTFAQASLLGGQSGDDSGESVAAASSSSSKAIPRASVESVDADQSVDRDEATVRLPAASPHAKTRRTSRPALSGLFDDVAPDRDDFDRHAPTTSRVLRQAGSSRDPYDQAPASHRLPLLVACPCRMRASSDYTEDLRDLVDTLESHARQPYLLVVFATPSPSIPVTVLVQAYRSLSAEARRNIKRLWIVHPGTLTKISVRLFLNTIVSGKVSRKGKVKLVDTLSALAKDLDLSQIDIPADVLLHNARLEDRILLPPNPSRIPVFGQPLTSIMQGTDLPFVVRDCIACLSQPDSLSTQGLLRRSPSLVAQNQLRDAYDRCSPVDLSEWPDHSTLAAATLKLFIRSLPVPVFPEQFYEVIRRCPQEDSEALDYIRATLVPSLRQEHPETEAMVMLLREVVRLLGAVAAKSDENSMTASNLAIVIAPILVHSDDIAIDTELCHGYSIDTASMMGTMVAPRRNAHLRPSGTNNTLHGVLVTMIEYHAEIFAQQPATDAKAEAASSARRQYLDGKEASPLRLLSTANRSPYNSKTVKSRATRSPADRQHVRGLFADVREGE